MENATDNHLYFRSIKNPSRRLTSTDNYEDNIETMQSTSRHTESTAEIPAVTDVDPQESNESAKEPR
jgi:hypothetical protein